MSVFRNIIDLWVTAHTRPLPITISFRKYQYHIILFHSFEELRLITRSVLTYEGSLNPETLGKH